MRKGIKKLLLVASSIILLAFILNIKVTTRQGIDYAVYIKRIPLYLKVLSFIDRHFQYTELAENIAGNYGRSEDKAVAILKWTHDNVHRQPKELPVIDDHVWHIIVRGYGANDQLEDVFATLCNYAGIAAFYQWIYRKDTNERKPFSFVKLEEGWAVFDAYNGVYFKNIRGQIATIADLSSNRWQAVSLRQSKIAENYSEFFKNLVYVDFKKSKYTRTTIQSPINRLIFWFKYGY